MKAACLRILQEFNLQWPESLSCSKFPASNDLENMCMEGGSARAGHSTRPFIHGAKTFQTFNSLRDLIPKVKVMVTSTISMEHLLNYLFSRISLKRIPRSECTTPLSES